MNWVWPVLFFVAFTLVIYHLLIYPVYMLVKSRSKVSEPPDFYHRGFNQTPLDYMLPRVNLIIPVQDSEHFIHGKICNIGAIDYPEHKLRVSFLTSDCNSNVARIMKQSASELQNCHLNIEVIETFGKQQEGALISSILNFENSDVIAISSLPTLLSTDSLLITAAQLNYIETGIVCGQYHFAHSLNLDHKIYERVENYMTHCSDYQFPELGADGAFYAFRTGLFKQLCPDSLKSDLGISASIVRHGYQTIYDARIISVNVSPEITGNKLKTLIKQEARTCQLVLKRLSFLNPGFGRVFFHYFSWSFLRLLSPILILIILMASTHLSDQSPVFLAIAESLGLCVALSLFCSPCTRPIQAGFINKLAFRIGSYSRIFMALFYLLFSKKEIYSGKVSQTRTSDSIPEQKKESQSS